MKCINVEESFPALCKAGRREDIEYSLTESLLAYETICATTPLIGGIGKVALMVL